MKNFANGAPSETTLTTLNPATAPQQVSIPSDLPQVLIYYPNPNRPRYTLISSSGDIPTTIATTTYLHCQRIRKNIYTHYTIYIYSRENSITSDASPRGLKDPCIEARARGKKKKGSAPCVSRRTGARRLHSHTRTTLERDCLSVCLSACTVILSALRCSFSRATPLSACH